MSRMPSSIGYAKGVPMNRRVAALAVATLALLVPTTGEAELSSVEQTLVEHVESNTGEALELVGEISFVKLATPRLALRGILSFPFLSFLSFLLSLLSLPLAH